MRKISTIGSLIFFFAVVLFFHGCQEKENQVIVVGANLPLTGDLSTYGEAIRDGVGFYQMEIDSKSNSERSVVKFNWQDNAGQPKNAVNIMRKHFMETVDIYVSGVKPQTMAIIDEISAKGIPHFVWIFDAFVCEDYKNTFRTWVSYKYEPEIYLKYVNNIAPERIAIIYANLPHSEEEFQEIVVPSLKNKGINNIMLEPYDWTKKDYKDIATKVDEFEPDLIILNGFKASLMGIVRAFRSFNLIDNNNTIATYDMLDAAEELPPDLVEGVRVVTPEFNLRSDNTLKEWKMRFENKFGRKPRYTDAYAYDMAQIIYDAGKRISLPASNKEWAEIILETDINGITGPLSFDKDGDLKISLAIGVYRDGELIRDLEMN